jgi:hypothetical protein
LSIGTLSVCSEGSRDAKDLRGRRLRGTAKSRSSSTVSCAAASSKSFKG